MPTVHTMAAGEGEKGPAQTLLTMAAPGAWEASGTVCVPRRPAWDPHPCGYLLMASVMGSLGAQTPLHMQHPAQCPPQNAHRQGILADAFINRDPCTLAPESSSNPKSPFL